MILAVNEIKSDGLFQSVIPNSNKNIYAIRPHLYIKNNPSGKIKIIISTIDDALISESEEISFSDITTQIEYHGYVRFLINAFLKKDQTYKIKIIGTSGYSFSDSSYCGVCGDYDLRKYTYTHEYSSKIVSPLDIEFWTLSLK